MVALILIASCGGTDTEKKECLEAKLLVENQCDQNISISYFELDDGFNILDLMLNYDGCDVVEKSRNLIPASFTEIVVYEGSCFRNAQRVFDSCIDFVTDEAIVVQYGDKVKEYPIYGTDHIVIVPSHFN